ncbi:MAG: tRNA pseudouridine(38-40) synthase TruA [Candidatus Zixiibacteriota bacterium]
MLRNIKLVIEYDGSLFHGWQVQPGLRTVQDEIEKALYTILNQKVNLIGAGRTDAGVHALGQVANFETENPQDAETIQKSLNGILPEDIVIHKAEEVDPNFNARYSAKSRIYKYRVHLGRTAIQRRLAWEVTYALNVETLLEATREIEGEHDFTSFCLAESGKESNLCNVKQAFWKKSGDELTFKIEANRFLHTMVRSLVGTLVEVARGYFSVSDFTEIIEAKDRRKAGPTAPAYGLYLVEVKY